MLYKRIIKLDIEGVPVTLSYPEVKITFKGEIDNDNEADIFEIKVYNRSSDTINLIKSGARISLQAGYEDDFGTINVGVIKDVMTYKEQSNVVTEIIMTTDSDEWTLATINKTFNPPINAKQILERITPLSGLETGLINLKDNVSYQRGKTVSGKVINVIKQIAKECNTPITISNGKINYTFESIKSFVIIKSDSGLISSVKKVNQKDSESEFIFDSIMLFKLKPKALVKIESTNVTGDFEVVKVKYNEDFTMSVEVKGVWYGIKQDDR